MRMKLGQRVLSQGKRVAHAMWEQLPHVTWPSPTRANVWPRGTSRALGHVAGCLAGSFATTALALALFGCATPWSGSSPSAIQDDGAQQAGIVTDTATRWWWDDLSDSDRTLMSIASYTGQPIVELDGNSPHLNASDAQGGAFQTYSELDELGRCGAAYACLGPETLSSEDRGDISDVYPSGWDGSTYGFIDQEKIFNRSHLIAHSLSGQDANERNLITGTRYFNAQSMQMYENEVLSYIRSTNNHVLYRVTPVFEGENLVASGVQMEGLSVEDDGAGVSFNVFCYNVQPGVVIDYSNGQNWLAQAYGGATDTSGAATPAATHAAAPETAGTQTKGATATSGSGDRAEQGTRYVLNTNSKKFHLPSCNGVAKIQAENRKDFTGSRQDLIDQGYSPCGACNP